MYRLTSRRRSSGSPAGGKLEKRWGKRRKGAGKRGLPRAAGGALQMLPVHTFGSSLCVLTLFHFVCILLPLLLPLTDHSSSPTFAPLSPAFTRFSYTTMTLDESCAHAIWSGAKKKESAQKMLHTFKCSAFCNSKWQFVVA